MEFSKSILNPNFIYTPSTHTNIMNTLKATGWKPPKQKYNPDCGKLEQIVRDLAFTDKYKDIPSTLKNAALVALHPSMDRNNFSHDDDI